MRDDLSVVKVLENTYNNVYDLLKFGESKNTTLIAFNGAIIIGLSALLKDVTLLWLKLYIAYIIAMCGVSIFLSFSSLTAKMKHKLNEISLTRSDNVLFFGTIACLNEQELVEKIKGLYGLQTVNEKYELDLARQLVIISQIVARKFRLFNLALRFMFWGLLTPISILIYFIFLNNDN